MSNIALQPCANAEAQKHYRETVESPVELRGMTSLLSSADIAALETFAEDDAIRVWGAKPGEDGRNEG